MIEHDVVHDNEAERAVLAACLYSKLAREEARRHLVGSDFHQPIHESIWRAMSLLDARNEPVDPTTVLEKVRTEPRATEVLPSLVTHPAVPDHVGAYAETVRGWSTKRALASAARQVLHRAMAPDADPAAYAAQVANEFAAIRDSGATEDITARTLAEILSEPEDEPDWLIPGYLERRDRLMLTGEEGTGKSHLLRQFALSAAAGMDPFGAEVSYEPKRVLIVDCENTENQVRRASRGLAGFVAHYGAPDSLGRILIHNSRRLDVTREKDLATIHREADAWQPDLMVIGPLYRLVPRAIQTDDDAAPVLSALDTFRDRGIALLIEAHAGHAIGKGGKRDLRPRGSSALLGWPEFGYGMRDIGLKGRTHVQFGAWRGDRSERTWPAALRRERDGCRWLPYDGPTDIPDSEWS